MATRERIPLWELDLPCCRAASSEPWRLIGEFAEPDRFSLDFVSQDSGSRCKLFEAAGDFAKFGLCCAAKRRCERSTRIA